MQRNAPVPGHNLKHMLQWRGSREVGRHGDGDFLAFLGAGVGSRRVDGVIQESVRAG